MGVVVVAAQCAGQAMAFNGDVRVNDQPVAGATVTLWAANTTNKPNLVKTATSNSKGKFSFDFDRSAPTKSVYYLTSSGGNVAGKAANGLALLTVVGPRIPGWVRLNGLTTVGSVWPNAQLLDGTTLSGNEVGLTIGAAQVANLVNISSGGYGATLLNGANLYDSQTMVLMNALADLLGQCADSEKAAGCQEFLQLTGAEDTLTALQNVARKPWKNADKLYGIFTKNFPVDKQSGLRGGATLPYLLFEPKDFALIIRFTEGGLFGTGKLLFDKDGNLWTGNNWMPGSQSGVVNSIGGGLTKLGPGGEALSPSPIGFNGQGLNGAGWGTGVSENKVWFGAFNRIIGVFDLNGKPLGPVKFGDKTGEFQGLATSRNNDVWVTDNTKDQMILFPKGDPSKAKIVKVPGMVAPFGVAVDLDNRVWVTSSEDNKLRVFPADNPSAVKEIEIALGGRGVAVDSKGNVWVSQQSSFKKYPWYDKVFMPPKPKSIMQEFEEGFDYLKNHTSEKDPIGQVALVTKDLKLVSWEYGKDVGIYVAWGMTIDGQDNVWVGNLFGMGAVHMCGVDTDVCPEGKKTGDIIHIYKSGVIERITDAIVDNAGNVWTANNWDDLDAIVNDNPERRISTMGGGHGVSVIYGVAKPVVNPLMGPVRAAQ